MVAFLAGLVVFLMFIAAGLWATLQEARNRIAELEALHAPPTSPPVAVARGEIAEPERDTFVDLPKLFELEGNDEPTQVCQVSST